MRSKISFPLGGAALALWVLGCGSGPNSVGVIVNHPTGLAFRHKLSRKEAITFALGADAFKTEVARGHIDWNQHTSRIRGGDWSPFWGVGAGYSVGIDSDNDEAHAALRIPLGFSLEFEDSSGDFFLQVVPSIDGGVDLVWALGLRFAL